MVTADVLSHGCVRKSMMIVDIARSHEISRVWITEGKCCYMFYMIEQTGASKNANSKIWFIPKKIATKQSAMFKVLLTLILFCCNMCTCVSIAMGFAELTTHGVHVCYVQCQRY